MRITGYIFVVISFLVGAFLVSVNKTQVDWGYFIPFLILGFIGIALIRIGQHKSTHAEEAVKENISDLESSVDNVIVNLKKISQKKEQLSVDDFHDEIDEHIADHLQRFVEARQTLIHVYDLKTYGFIMSDFAGGERYINRIWCASVDGYIDEVNEYLEKAELQFGEVRKKLQKASELKTLPGAIEEQAAE